MIGLRFYSSSAGVRADMCSLDFSFFFFKKEKKKISTLVFCCSLSFPPFQFFLLSSIS